MADDTTALALSAKQYNAISALMTQPSVRKALEECGVPERTMYKWLKSPLFVAEYRQARREATQQAIARLQQVSGAAVSVLVQLMATSTPAVKLGAAKTILEMAIRVVELEDLEARLQAL